MIRPVRVISRRLQTPVLRYRDPSGRTVALAGPRLAAALEAAVQTLERLSDPRPVSGVPQGQPHPDIAVIEAQTRQSYARSGLDEITRRLGGKAGIPWAEVRETLENDDA
jgi:hypothetical protein